MGLGKEGVCLCQKGGFQGFQGQPIKRRFGWNGGTRGFVGSLATYKSLVLRICSAGGRDGVSFVEVENNPSGSTQVT